MRKRLIKYIEVFLLPVFIFYMLRVTSNSVANNIENQIKALFTNFSVEEDYLWYLFLHIIDIIIIFFYTYFVEKRQIIFKGNGHNVALKDIIWCFVIGGGYISIQIAVNCIFGAGYLTSGVFSHVIVVYFILDIIHSFAEELLFRGYFLLNNEKYNNCYLIIVSALIFALSHDFELINFLDQFIFGLALAIIVVKKRNIILSTILHATNNFFLTNIFGTVGKDYQSILYLQENTNVSISIFDNGSFVVFLRIILLLFIILVFSRKRINA